MVPLLQCACGALDTTSAGGVASDCFASRKIATLSPSEALKLGSQGPQNSCITLAISVACAAGTGQYNEAEFVAFSLELIQRSVPNQATPGIWGIPLHCLNAYLVQDAAKQFLASGHLLVPRIHSVLPDIVDAIWRDRDLLRTHGALEDIVRVTVAMFLKSLYVIGPLKRYLLTADC